MRGALCLLVMLASGSAAQSLPRAERRDSSGVRIIEYATIKTARPAFTIAPKLLADVGGLRDDPKDEIEAKTGYEVAVRFSDGKIAVAENYTIRVLDASGKFVRLIGAKGGGPGEFNSQITGMCVIRGDTLIARDGSRRVNAFDAAGQPISSTTIDGYVDGNCGADGSMFIVVSAPSSMRGRGGAPAPANTDNRAAVWRADRSGKRVDSVGAFPSTSYSPFTEGRFSIGVAGDRLFADNGDAAEVKGYSLAGKLTTIIRWRDPLTPLTDKLADSIAGFRVPLNDPNRTERIASMRAMPHPAYFPAYSGFFVDRAGRLWVRDYWSLGAVWKIGWTVFGTDGTLLGRYEPPAIEGSRTMVTDAGKDFIVVRVYSRDEGVRVLVQSIVTPP